MVSCCRHCDHLIFAGASRSATKELSVKAIGRRRNGRSICVGYSWIVSFETPAPTDGTACHSLGRHCTRARVFCTQTARRFFVHPSLINYELRLLRCAFFFIFPFFRSLALSLRNRPPRDSHRTSYPPVFHAIVSLIFLSLLFFSHVFPSLLVPSFFSRPKKASGDVLMDRPPPDTRFFIHCTHAN